MTIVSRRRLRFGLRPIRALPLCFGAAALLALTAHGAFWTALAAAAPPTSLATLAFHGSVFVVLVAALGLVLSLFAFRHVLKPALVLALVVAAACAYFMDSYGVVIDRSMVRNVLETDAAEATALLSRGLVLRVLLAGVAPAVLVLALPLRFGSLREEALTRLSAAALGLALIGGLVLAQYKTFSIVFRAHDELRLLVNPTSPLLALVQVLSRSGNAGPVVPIARDARRAVREGRSSLVVVVVGETARAASFSLNGYERDTNPRLAGYPIVDFPQVRSCGTSTAESLPCMFSPGGREAFDPDRVTREENLLDVLQRVGVRVLWRDNNSGCKHVCARVPTEHQQDFEAPALCRGAECYDEALLTGLQAYLDGLEGDALLVLHQNGSHGPAYHARTPVGFKRFLPECVDGEVQRCSREAIVNAYDNTILYTDFVLAELIDLLGRNAERLDSALLYVSDHGESLGEHGLYLHGLPYALAPDEQTHVPMLAWLSPGFASARSIDLACLDERRSEPRSHDHVFHSLLGLFGVESRVYRPERDLFAPCRSEAPVLAPVLAAGRSLARN
jgi:lipid A ethanolaminephosphotransferase